MKVWRGCLVAFLLVFVALPLAAPFVECFSQLDSDWAWLDAAHLWRMLSNTLLLTSGTVALALPAGTLMAVLLFRTDLSARKLWLFAVVLTLFLPLPVLMSGWQAFVGSDGWMPLASWGTNGNRPWTTGIWPAIWVHSLAGLPWVILIVGSGLATVERELEEEALLWAGPFTVLRRVTLPRCRLHLIAASVWLALFTAGEISVTYFLQVPTFAEEIHSQFAGGSRQALARSVALSLPMVALLWLLLLVFVPRLRVPAMEGWLSATPLFRMGRVRPWLATLVLTAAIFAFVLPLAGLVLKLGLSGWPRAWDASTAWNYLATEARVSSSQMLNTLAATLLTASFTIALGVVCCWLARDCRWLQWLLLCLMTLIWALPATVIGIGLLEFIQFLVVHVPFEPMAKLLYHGPSPVPAMWAQLIRFLPVACALVWPSMRMMPAELVDWARLEGAGPDQELLHVAVPWLRPRLGWILILISALCLGEVAASSHVQTPGFELFQKVVFTRMHYGVDSAVAALCLLLLLFLTASLIFGLLLRRWLTSGGPVNPSDGP